MNYVLGEAPTSESREFELVREVFQLDPSELGVSDLDEFDNLVKIVQQFSRVNPATGEAEQISPSRVAAIPAITARHIELVQQARGVLTPEQVREVWLSNMPANTGDRHPDLLFDIAQYNFGTDEPIDDILRAINQAEIRRQKLIERYRSMLRQQATRYRYERPLDDDETEEAADFIVDALTGQS